MTAEAIDTTLAVVASLAAATGVTLTLVKTIQNGRRQALIHERVEKIQVNVNSQTTRLLDRIAVLTTEMHKAGVRVPDWDPPEGVRDVQSGD